MDQERGGCSVYPIDPRSSAAVRAAGASAQIRVPARAEHRIAARVPGGSAANSAHLQVYYSMTPETRMLWHPPCVEANAWLAVLTRPVRPPTSSAGRIGCPVIGLP